MDYMIGGPPTISHQVFVRELEESGSPILVEIPADIIWQISVNRGIDPNAFLAIMEHEGQYGKNGAAARNKNPGNLRPKRDRSIGRAKRISSDDFRVYAHWIDALRDMGDLLHDVYSKMTIDQAIWIWAPLKDNNIPTAYIKAVKDNMRKWNADQG